MKNKPHEDAQRTAQQLSEVGQLLQGTVKQAPNHTLGEDNKHVVKVEVGGATDWADVLVTSYGDVYLPQPNDTVLLGRMPSSQLIVLGVAYTSSDSDIDGYQSGERRITHSLSGATITLDANGDITIENDNGATVTLSGTDITVNHAGTGKVRLANDDGTTSPVARKGDNVTDSNGNIIGSISEGSPSVETY